jgi:hypothetical protein
MQVIRANHLHGKKEDNKESLRKHQEERRGKNIIKIGDQTECPECRTTSRVVWMSQDGKTAGIQCPASHSLAEYAKSGFALSANSSRKTSRKMVFITEIK